MSPEISGRTDSRRKMESVEQMINLKFRKNLAHYADVDMQISKFKKRKSRLSRLNLANQLQYAYVS